MMKWFHSIKFNVFFAFHSTISIYSVAWSCKWQSFYSNWGGEKGGFISLQKCIMSSFRTSSNTHLQTRTNYKYIYVRQIQIVSMRKMAPFIIIKEPAARALRLRSLKRKSELSCHWSMTKAPEITKRMQPAKERMAFNDFSTVLWMMCPLIKIK